jgi:nitrogen-specific signal transduction histidine kinase
MDDATLARIFEPFLTTKFTGLGLGLSAVLGIVRGHGGVLKVQSTPGAGARFLTALPLHDGALELRAPGVSMPPRAELQGTVLLVDDDPHVLSVTQTMLDSMESKARKASGNNLRSMVSASSRRAKASESNRPLKVTAKKNVAKSRRSCSSCRVESVSLDGATVADASAI